MPRAKQRKTVKTSKELRELLSALSPAAVDLLSDVLADTTIEIKVRIDAAKFIISEVLNDPEALNQGDSLIKLAAILKDE